MVAGDEVVKQLKSDVVSVVGGTRLEGSDGRLGVDSVVVEEVRVLVQDVPGGLPTSLFGKSIVSLGTGFVRG